MAFVSSELVPHNTLPHSKVNNQLKNALLWKLD